jgi:hypothetical protein
MGPSFIATQIIGRLPPAAALDEQFDHSLSTRKMKFYLAKSTDPEIQG